MYYHDLTILARAAALLKKNGDAAALPSPGRGPFAMPSIERLFNPEKNLLRLRDANRRQRSSKSAQPGSVRPEDETAMRSALRHRKAIPLALGMVDPDRVEAVFDNLIADVAKRE